MLQLILREGVRLTVQEVILRRQFRKPGGGGA